jgi:hypothetical protein
MRSFEVGGKAITLLGPKVLIHFAVRQSKNIKVLEFVGFRNGASTIAFFWNVATRQCAIGGRLFEIAKWSHLQRSKIHKILDQYSVSKRESPSDAAPHSNSREN